MAFREDELHGVHYPFGKKFTTFIFMFIVLIVLLYLFMKSLSYGFYILSALLFVLIILVIPFLAFEVDRVFWKGG